MILIFGQNDAKANKKVTIATIGGLSENVKVGDSREPQKMVEQIIEYWRGQLNKVIIEKPDLILLTEACDRPNGVTTEEKVNFYKIRKNQILDYFSSVAKANHCYIAFGMKREDHGIWWNSCVLLDRMGKVAGIYNKNYPVVDEMEGGIKASNESPVFQCDFGKVACAICFDLNFDELRERYAKLKPDIILFPSMYHGGLEQSKWAYSCNSFFVGSMGFRELPSEIRNPLGDIVASSTNDFNYAVSTINLDRKLVHLDNNWGKLNELKMKYGNEVSIIENDRLNVLMITSEKEGVSAEDMIKEFNIELLDDYFNRSRQQRNEQLRLNN